MYPSEYMQDTCKIHQNTSGYVSDRKLPPKTIGNPPAPRGSRRVPEGTEEGPEGPGVQPGGPEGPGVPEGSRGPGVPRVQKRGLEGTGRDPLTRDVST